MKLTVEGMTCGHCVRSITTAIQALEPGARVSVDLDARSVAIQGVLGADAARAAIEAEGYTVVAVDADAGLAEAAPAKSCCGTCHA
ncbi:MAG TPA: heavy-metal-associated domain-containing protein [Lysobacter sp.]|nr:heavy-metal-associated domain-containing protein [Lysobacter sp.]